MKHHFQIILFVLPASYLIQQASEKALDGELRVVLNHKACENYETMQT